MAAQAMDLVVWPGRDRRTKQRVWAVLSRSRTSKAGYPVFHLVAFDYRAGQWRCPCESVKACVHTAAASNASRAEKEREYQADAARRAGYTSTLASQAPRVMR